MLLLIACTRPDFELADGKEGNLEDFKGKWLVINYWADWCPPCIKEMPELTDFYNSNNNKVNVLAHNFDRLEGKELLEQIERFKVKVPSLITNPEELFGWEKPSSLPTTYIIDPQGDLIHVLIGPQTKESLENLINQG
tara:strand:+ start:83055 stop:83468 length:414 start_codon:yes stop_codon:yes gene_type:complete